MRNSMGEVGDGGASGALVSWVAKAAEQKVDCWPDHLRSVVSEVGYKLYVECKLGEEGSWEPCTLTALGEEAGFLVTRPDGSKVGQREPHVGEVVEDAEEATCTLAPILDGWGVDKLMRPPAIEMDKGWEELSAGIGGGTTGAAHVAATTGAARPARHSTTTGGAPTSATAKVGAADPHAGATASAAAGKGVAENAEQVEKAADDFPSNLQCRTRVKVL